MSVNIGLDAKGREEIAKALNKYLANLHVLYTKLHNYHWNIEGRSFFTIHGKLEELYNKAAEEIDEIAERILTLGYRPAASMKEYLELASLKEVSSQAIQGEGIIKALQADFEVLIGELREALRLADEYDDQVTVDMFVGIIANYEKTLWMFRAYLA